LPEQDSSQVTDEGIRSGGDDDAECEHPDEQQSDGGVTREAESSLNQSDSTHHHSCTDRRAEDPGESEKNGQGNSRQHPMGESVADERKSPEHHEGASNRARD
jgi:hypothetical protein